MHVRSLLGLIALFVVVTGAVWVAQLNSGPVTVRLPGLEPFSAPLWVVLLLTLLSGLLLALVYSLVLTSRDAIAGRRYQRANREARERVRRTDRGMALLLSGRPAEAGEILAEVAAEEPGNADAWLRAGVASRRAEDPEAARGMHLRALSLRPEDPTVLDELARDAEALGDLGDAVRYLRQALEHGAPDVERLRRLRDLRLAAGAWDEAVDAQARLIEACPDAEAREEAQVLRGMRVGRGRRALEMGDASSAEAIADELLVESPDFEPAHALRVDALLARQEPRAALDALERGVARTRSLELLRRHAALLVDLEEPEEAIRSLRSAVKTQGEDRELAVRILLGRLYMRLELIDEALAEFRAVAERVEFSPVVNYYLARLHARRGDHRAARELLEDALRRSRVLDFRYRCPDCGTVGPEYGRRCHDLCPTGTVEMEVTRDASPTKSVEAPTV